jgi:hypothetical protein
MRGGEGTVGSSDSILKRLSASLREERGLAIPTTLLVLVIGIGFSMTAIVASISSQRGSVRDQDRKTAIAAADTGIDEAILRQNKIATTPSNPCLRPTVSSGLLSLAPGPAEADGWCPTVSGTVGSATYAYRTYPVPPAAGDCLRNSIGQCVSAVNVVSAGSSDGVSRRVMVNTSAPSGVDIFGNYRAVGVDDVTVGGSSDVDVSTGTNGDLTIENNATLCGDGRHGPGHGAHFNNNGTQCTGYGIFEGSQELPPPNLTEVYASSDTSRFFSLDTRTGNATWDPTTKTLELHGNASVTLGGKNYLFCQLVMDGSSKLIMAKNAGNVTPEGFHQIRLYFDSPENCGQDSGVVQVSLTGTASIISTGYNPNAGAFDMPGIYMLGSDDRETNAIFNGTGNVQNEFLLYAPRTHVELGGTAEYVGPVAGLTLETSGTALLTSDANMPNPDVQTVIVYKRERYVECTGATGAPPDANC